MLKTYGSIEEYFLEVKQALAKVQAFVLSSQITYDSRTITEGTITGKIVLIDKSELHIREYISIDNKKLQRLTYRFHWQDEEKQLIARWDNAPHHPQIKTHPHHKHTSSIILESEEMTTIKLMQEIIQQIKIN